MTIVETGAATVPAVPYQPTSAVVVPGRAKARARQRPAEVAPAAQQWVRAEHRIARRTGCRPRCRLHNQDRTWPINRSVFNNRFNCIDPVERWCVEEIHQDFAPIMRSCLDGPRMTVHDLDTDRIVPVRVDHRGVHAVGPQAMMGPNRRGTGGSRPDSEEGPILTLEEHRYRRGPAAPSMQSPRRDGITPTNHRPHHPRAARGSC